MLIIVKLMFSRTELDNSRIMGSRNIKVEVGDNFAIPCKSVGSKMYFFRSKNKIISPVRHDIKNHIFYWMNVTYASHKYKSGYYYCYGYKSVDPYTKLPFIARVRFVLYSKNFVCGMFLL